MESDLSESDKLRKLQEETLSRIRLECSNVEAKNIEKEQGSTDQDLLDLVEVVRLQPRAVRWTLKRIKQSKNSKKEQRT